MNEFNLEKLRERAEKILNQNGVENQILSYKEANKLINDLRTYQIEVELQNEDLRNVILEIEESRQQYMNLYDFIPFGFFTVTTQGIIKEVNPAAVELLGVNKNELINRAFSRYIVPEFQYIYSEHRRLALENMTLQSCEIKMMSKKGYLFHTQVDIKAIKNSITNEIEFIIFVQDIPSGKVKKKILLIILILSPL